MRKNSEIIAPDLVLCFALCAMLFALCSSAEAQQPKVYRVGVVTAGSVWYEEIDGLRVGLKQLGFEEGKQFTLEIRDTKGDMKAAEVAARQLEQDNVKLIFATQTSVALATRNATKDIPIVFCAGADPVNLGLVASFRSPGGRLTGVFYRLTDVTGKRLEILKEIVPNVRRVLTFYNPNNPVGVNDSKFAREAARHIGVELVEQHVVSPKELDARLQALKARQVDAFFGVSDAMVINQNQLIINTAIVKKLPTMFQFVGDVINGGLASYDVSLHEAGRLSAKYVQRILTGLKPEDLPVEGVDKIDLVINLKTAKQIGLPIPPNVLARANRVIK